MIDISNYCYDCKNFFLKNGVADIHTGVFEIKDGVISNVDTFLVEGQYFAIKGSKLNDGVYKYTPEGTKLLLDEKFKGAVWDMSVPPAFLVFVESAEAFKAKCNELSATYAGFQSESFAGYSYSLPSSAPEYMQEWQDRIMKDYRRWRRLSIL